MAASVVFGFTPAATSAGVMATSSTKLHFRTKPNSDLGFLASQLSGIKISSNHSLISPSPISPAPLRPSLQPIARNIPLSSQLSFNILLYFICSSSTPFGAILELIVWLWLKHFLFQLGFLIHPSCSDSNLGYL